jgi:SAM-dependent methyltransferase
VTRLYTDDVELYDIAFTWDLTDEVDWLLERFGPECRSVLEPGSGTGRMLEALARRGLAVVGLDVSEAMVAYSRERLAAGGADAEVVHADMTTFDLGRTFDAAVCPINTLLHLTPSELEQHFDRVAEHLVPGTRYLVQVGLFDGSDLPPPNEWDADRNGTAVHCLWAPVARDLEAGRETHRSVIEVTAGARRGEIVEELHEMTAWTPARWRRAVAESPFEEVATYDGGLRERPRVELEQCGGLLWHELVAQ